jgi:hypothetical protein
MSTKPLQFELVFCASLASFEELEQEDYTVILDALRGALEDAARQQRILPHVTSLQLREPRPTGPLLWKTPTTVEHGS